MTEEELKELYAQVLQWSKDIPATQRIENPQATVTMVSPLCGSQITIDLSLEKDRVVAFAQKVRACTLGAAAASIVGRNVIGHSAKELRELRAQMHAMLKHDGPVPQGEWHELSVLEPARDLISRHGSIMLVFDALVEALDEIEERPQPSDEDVKGIPDTIRA